MKNFSHTSIFKTVFFMALTFACISFSSFTSQASSSSGLSTINDFVENESSSSPFSENYKYFGYSKEWTSLDTYNKRVANSIADYKSYVSNFKKQKLNASVYDEATKRYHTDYYLISHSDSLRIDYSDETKNTVMNKTYSNNYSRYVADFSVNELNSKPFLLYTEVESKTGATTFSLNVYFYDDTTHKVSKIDSRSGYISGSHSLVLHSLNTGSSAVSNSNYNIENGQFFYSHNFYHNDTVKTKTYDIERHLYSIDTNFLIFKTEEAAIKYFRDGDESGIYRTPFQGSEDNVPDDNPDVELGYLKGLDLWKSLPIYNEENGGTFDSQTFFRWADTYDFDDSYYVEVSARVRGQYKPTPLNFGFSSKIENYTGKIRPIKIVPYNDLGVDFCHKSDVLPFIQKDLDELKELTPFGSVNAFDIDYFFRICHKTSSGYKYGPYTAHINTSDNLFKGETTNYEIQYGTVDSEGNLILDSDLPPEKPTPPIIGTGSSFEEAEKDANDPNNPTNPDNQGKPGFDLSLENISQVFTWFIDSMKNIIVSLGSFPQFIASVFPFLPSSFSTFLMIGLAVVIILRLLGR